MIRIAITPAAYDAICSTLPEDELLLPVHRHGGQCLIHVEAAVLDRLRAMRTTGKVYTANGGPLPSASPGRPCTGRTSVKCPLSDPPR